jgi:Family of unknown function (DUF6941)
VNVDWAIPCRYAEVHPQGGSTIVGAGTDLHTVPELPMAVPVLFTVRFIGAPEELDGVTPHPVSCRIFGPDGGQLGEQSVELTSAVTQRVPGYLADVTLPIGIVLEVTEHGTYGIEFQIDTAPPMRVPIHMVEPPAE